MGGGGPFAWRAQGMQYTLPASHDQLQHEVEVAAYSVHFFVESRFQSGAFLIGEAAYRGRAPVDGPGRALQDYRAFCMAEANASPVTRATFDRRMDAL